MDMTTTPKPKSSLDCDYEFESFYPEPLIEDIGFDNKPIVFNDDPINTLIEDIGFDNKPIVFNDDPINTLFEKNKERQDEIKHLTKMIGDLQTTIQNLNYMNDTTYFKMRKLEEKNKYLESVINDLKNGINKMLVHESFIQELKNTSGRLIDLYNQPTHNETNSTSSSDNFVDVSYNINFKNIDQDLWFEKKISDNKKIYYLKNNIDESITFKIMCNIMEIPTSVMVHNNTKKNLVFEYRNNKYTVMPSASISIAY